MSEEILKKEHLAEESKKACICRRCVYSKYISKDTGYTSPDHWDKLISGNYFLRCGMKHTIVGYEEKGCSSFMCNG